MAEVIFVTREELVDKVMDHLADLHCTTWGKLGSNWRPEHRRENAEWVAGVVFPELRRMAHENGLAWGEFFTATQFLMLTLGGRTIPRQPIAPNPFNGLP